MCTFPKERGNGNEKREPREMKVLLTGGGSGGHVSPMLAVAGSLKQLAPDTAFLYVGAPQGLEATIVPRTDIPIAFAPAVGMPGGKFSPAMFRFLVTLTLGVFKAMGLLLKFKPDVIVASGGFASAPSVFAAGVWRVLTFGQWKLPVYLHEQNAAPGRMNLAAAQIATRIGLAHEAGKRWFPAGRAETVGYPVRGAMHDIDRAAAREELGLKEGEQYVVVFGGSQGARTINRAIVDALPYLARRSDLRIIHASGTMKGAAYDSKKDTEARLAELGGAPNWYQRVDYLHDMPVHLAAADLAVIRAGAGALLEVCALGVPSIVIPKANLPGDSQVANARELAASGAIDLVYEEPTLTEHGLVEEVAGEQLAQRIHALLDGPSRRRELAECARRSYDPKAADRVARKVIALAKGGTGSSVGNVASAVITDRPPIIYESPTQLRRGVERRLGLMFEKAFLHGRIEDDELSRLDDLDYLHYRGAALLVHPAWQLRNEGVKLLGLTRHEDRLSLLLHVLNDRTPAPKWHQMLGGDFKYVGFERRNVLSSLAFMGLWNPQVRDACFLALDDPYYEVRSAALKLLRTLQRDRVGVMDPDIRPIKFDDEIPARVRKLCGDISLEVRVEALHTFGWVGAPQDVLEVCLPLLQHQKVLVREGVLKAFHALINRYGRERDWVERLQHELDEFLITSVAVQPHYPLKQQFAMLQKRLLAGGAQ